MSDARVVEASVGEGVELPLPLERVEEAVRLVLQEEGVEEAEISLAFVDDAGITRLNQEYLGHEGPTDVISFALHGPGERPLGDVYVGVDQAFRQATEVGAEAGEELLRLAIHGTLHVLGYDHPAEAEREASPMYRRQEELLTTILDRIRPAGR